MATSRANKHEGWPACERCGREQGRRRKCAVCGRMLCRECQELPRMKDEVVWCRYRDELGRQLDACPPHPVIPIAT